MQVDIDVRYETFVPANVKKHIATILETIQNAGGECYLVGGSVRDLLLGYSPKEYDFTTSLHPEQIQKLFKRVFATGIEHGTVTVLLDNISYEVTSFRSESEYVDGRRPEKVEFGVSLEEDLKRRDFTFNAFAYSPNTSRNSKSVFYDLHSGIVDLEQKRIRTIGDPIERFTEDGLRPIRAIRFTSQLGFAIEEKTWEAIASCKSITAKVSVERVSAELEKIFLTPKPLTSLDLFLEFGFIDLFWKQKHLYADGAEKEPYGSSFDSQMQLGFIDQFFLHPTQKDLSLFWFLFLWKILKRVPDSKAVSDFSKSLKLSRQKISEMELYSKIFQALLTNFPKNLFAFKKEILFPILKFQNLRTSENPFLLTIQTYFVFLKSGNFITGESLEFLEVFLQNPSVPIVLSDLVINGDSILRRYPKIDKTQIGKILQECLELVWEFPEGNTELAIWKKIEERMS